MDDEGVLEAARAIRPYLTDLVGPAAEQLDRRIAELLAAAVQGENVADTVRSLLDSREVTMDFVAEVLADVPHYRPPYLQPGYLLSPQPRLRTDGRQCPTRAARRQVRLPPRRLRLVSARGRHSHSTVPDPDPRAPPAPDMTGDLTC